MATTVSFTYDGKDYCLEYTRKTVKQMEDRGFIASRIVEAPMSVLPELWAGAFLANHKYTDRKVIDEIYDKMKDRKALLATLSTMYNEPIEALMSDSKEVDEGNAIAWVANK
jgi:hypothetical protein